MKNMDPLVIVTIGGFIGGIVRGIIGVLKSIRMGRELKVKYFVTSLIASGLIGAIAGLFAGNDLRFAILAGYVGGDFLESLYKYEFKSRFGYAK